MRLFTLMAHPIVFLIVLMFAAPFLNDALLNVWACDKIVFVNKHVVTTGWACENGLPAVFKGGATCLRTIRMTDSGIDYGSRVC